MKALLIDGNNYAYRGYWAFKDPLTSRDGFPTNVILGFFTILSTDIKVLRPTHLAVSFDRTPSARRLALYPEYKGQREHSEADVVKPQMRVIRKILKALGIPTLGIVGEESDDIIATLATMFDEEGFNKVLISSTDKDFAQLVNKCIHIVEARSRNLIDPKGVKGKWGVKPTQMLDYLTMIGDGVDNIPGINGVAAKTAVKLLTQYGTLDEVVLAAKAGELTPALTRNILEFKKSGQLKLSRRLVRPYLDVPVKFNPERFEYDGREVDDDRIERICKELDLTHTYSLIKGLMK